jgi:hypothetical protein
MNRREILFGSALTAATSAVGPPFTTALATTRCEDCVLPERSKYLLLDPRLIASNENVALTLGEVKKHPANPLFTEEKPWEPYYDNNFPNVFYDEQEKIYKCWYMPFIVSNPHSQVPRPVRKPGSFEAVITAMQAVTGIWPLEEGICYAISHDGIRWEKPMLGVIEFNGNTENNIVARLYHGPGIFKDVRDPHPTRRYKMFFLDKTGTRVKCGKSGGHSVAFSADGLRWTSPRHCPKIGGVYDALHSVFWDTDLRKYVGFMRMYTHGRAIGRTESIDFENWTESSLVLHGTDYIEVSTEPNIPGSLEFKNQVYSMPVFPYAGVYLGLPAIYNIEDDLVRTELAWSPDTFHWHRICPGTPLIPPSATDLGAASRVPKDSRSYDWGCIYAADRPIILEDEIRIYYNGSNGSHNDWRDGFFCLATLRPDGFAGYECSSGGVTGTIITNKVKCSGKYLHVMADVIRGSLEVAVLGDKDVRMGQLNNSSDGAVRWTHGSDLTRYRGKPLRLKFRMRGAKLYAFNFTD